MRYKINPKYFKKLPKEQQEFYANPKNAAKILSPESNKKVDYMADKFMLKTRGLLPKD